MPRYMIETAGQRRKVRARDPEHAAIIAFKREPFRGFTRAAMVIRIVQIDPNTHEEWFTYTPHVIRAAGFDLSKEDEEAAFNRR